MKYNFLFVFLSFIFFMFSNQNLSAQDLSLEWVRPISGSGGTIITSSITIDQEENVFAVGGFKDSVEVLTKSGPVKLISKGLSDLFIAKIDPSGAIDWIKSIGGRGNLGDDGGLDLGMKSWFSITSDMNSNIYITGMMKDTVDFNPGGIGGIKSSRFIITGGGPIGNPNPTKSFLRNSFILKLNSKGEFKWVTTLTGSSTNAASAIAIDHKEGTICITGYIKDTVDFNNEKGTDLLITKKNVQNTFVAKYDTSGNFVWARQMGEKGNNDQGIGIHIDDRGYVYATGVYSDSADYDPGTGVAYLTSPLNVTSNSFALKLDAKGNYVWAKAFGGAQSKGLGSRSSGITTDQNGNVFTTGYFQGIGNFDPKYDPVNNKTTNKSTLSAFISKLDSNGNYVWAKTFDRPNSSSTIDNGLSIQADRRGNVFFTGYFSGSIYLDPNSANLSRMLFQTGSGNSITDVFAVKLNENGDFIWGRQFKTIKNPPGTSAGASLGKNIKISSSNNMYLAGYFVGTTDFDPNGIATIINSINPDARAEDGFVAKFICKDTSSSNLSIDICADKFEFYGKSYKESGEYVQNLQGQSGCDSTIYLSLILKPIPHPIINVDEFKLGTSERFKTYQWMYNGASIPDATDSIIFVTKNGAYRVIVTNDAGCKDTSDVYDVKNVTTIKDIQSVGNQIKVYPNPAIDLIKLSSPIAVNIQLFDIEGRIILMKKNVGELNIKGLSAGMYFLNIYDVSGNFLKVEKIIKE